MSQEITPISTSRWSGLWANMPGYDLAERVIDVFGSREKIQVIVTDANYFRLSLFGRLFEVERGSKREFLIEGGKNFCDAAIRALESSKGTAKMMVRQMDARRPWNPGK